ncbi:MAG: 1-phosphofructokinase [Firmicutes bacterium]|nr:1-phosphofructokinase [Bacillota bacterium]
MIVLIATVTLNPCIDRTLELDHLVVGGLNRVKNKLEQPSGKGINVSRALSRWGQPTEALTMVGGNSGHWLVKRLEELDISVDWVEVQDDTRTNLKVWAVLDKCVTEINEPGPMVTEEELQELQAKVSSKASEWDWVVISGSVPPGTPQDFYAGLIETAKSKGARVALDASGIGLRAGLEAGPDLIKPNETEAAQVLGWELRDEAGAVAAVGELAQRGIDYVLLTLGKAGGFLGHKGQIWQGIPPEVVAQTTVGCGDSTLAGMVWALREGKDLAEAMCWAMAAGAAAATTRGTEPPEWATVEELVEQVRVCRHR